MKQKLIVLVAVFLSLTGCVNPGIVKVSQDRYVITRTDKAGIFGNASTMKAEVIQEAQQFAESQGMQAVPVSVQERPLQVGRSFASITYEFKLADNSGASPELAAIKAKCDSDYNNTLALDPIRNAIPEFGSQATISQRANSKKPIGPEKGAIEVLDQLKTDCRKNLIAYYRKSGAPADFIVLATKNMTQQTDILTELWSGKITYGQYATKRIALEEKFREGEAKIFYVERARDDANATTRAQIAIAEQESKSRTDSAQQAADAQSSMAATQSMMLINQQAQQRAASQPAPAIRQPINTNCQKYGNQVNCQTY